MNQAPQAIERLNVGLGAGAVAASLAFGSPHFAASLAAGAALEAVNFHGLASHARAMFATADPSLAANREPGRWVGIFSLRFFFLIGGMFFALWAGAHPVGLVLGISLIMPAAVIGAWLHRPEIIPFEPEAPLAPDDPSWDRWSVWQGREVEPHSEDDA